MEEIGQLHAQVVLPQWKEILLPQSRSERGGEEKISKPLPGLKPPNIQPVAQRYTTESVL
jgi:hypothetical protein